MRNTDLIWGSLFLSLLSREHILSGFGSCMSWSSRIISALLSSRQGGAFHGSQIVSLTLQYWSSEGEAPNRTRFQIVNSKCQIQTLQRGKAQIVSLRFQYRCGVRWDGAVGDRGDCLHLDKVAEDCCHTSSPKSKVFWLFKHFPVFSPKYALGTPLQELIVSTKVAHVTERHYMLKWKLYNFFPQLLHGSQLPTVGWRYMRDQKGKIWKHTICIDWENKREKMRFFEAISSDPMTALE